MLIQDLKKTEIFGNNLKWIQLKLCDWNIPNDDDWSDAISTDYILYLLEIG